VSGASVRAVAEIDQIIELGVDDEDDVTTFASIATVRPAFGYKFFPQETDGSTPSISRIGMKANSINEHERIPSIGRDVG
jgi:hypothetical protein